LPPDMERHTPELFRRRANVQEYDCANINAISLRMRIVGLEPTKFQK
jgi:hypothetical protein